MTAKEMKKWLRDLKKSLRPSKEQFKAYAGIVKEERERGFIAGKSPTGETWTPLSPKTIARKSGKHKTTRTRKGVVSQSKAKPSKTPSSPLIDTGQLMRPTTGATATYGYVRLAVSRSTPVSGSDSISTIHQEGLGNNPVREHWGIYTNASERIRKLFLIHVKEVLNAR